MSFTIKQNDTSPVIAATLKDASGTPVNLTAATVQFHMRKIGGSTLKVDAAATLVDAAQGSIKYTWTGSDTDSAGNYSAEFEVTYSDGTIETFPNGGNISIIIAQNLG